jgi:hypothetical protein
MKLQLLPLGIDLQHLITLCMRFNQSVGWTDISYGTMAGSITSWNGEYNTATLKPSIDDDITPAGIIASGNSAKPSSDSVVQTQKEWYKDGNSDRYIQSPHHEYELGTVSIKGVDTQVWAIKDWKEIRQLHPISERQELRQKIKLLQKHILGKFKTGFYTNNTPDNITLESVQDISDYNDLEGLYRESSKPTDILLVKPIGLAKEFGYAYYQTENNQIIKICVYKSATQQIQNEGISALRQVSDQEKAQMKESIEKLDDQFQAALQNLNYGQTAETIQTIKLESIAALNTPRKFLDWMIENLKLVEDLEPQADSFFSLGDQIKEKYLSNGSVDISSHLKEYKNLTAFLGNYVNIIPSRYMNQGQAIYYLLQIKLQYNTNQTRSFAEFCRYKDDNY